MKHRTVRQIITRPQAYALPAGASVRDAARLMAEQHIGAVLVMAGERLDGIFTERDALYRVVAEGRDPETTRLGEVMTSKLVTLSPDDAASDALRLMRDIGFRHLPVVEGDKVFGVISLRDFIGPDVAAATLAGD